MTGAPLKTAWSLEDGIALTVQWYEDNGGVEQTYTHLAVKA